MRQLLLRIPDEVHHRLTARAARSGRSVNAIANEILDAAVDADTGDRRTRARARALALGILVEGSSVQVSPARRRRILATTRGTGPIADELLADDRDRV